MILQEEMTLGQETRSSLHYCSLQFKNNFFKALSSEKRSELKGISIDWSACPTVKASSCKKPKIGLAAKGVSIICIQ